MAAKTKIKDVDVSKKDMTKAQWTWHLMKEYKVGYLMVAPFGILFFFFQVLPVFLSIAISFTSYDILEAPKWVGLQNYITLFLDDDYFILALKYTLIFAVLTGPASYILSFVNAWFINELQPKMRSIVTFIFYAPSITTGANAIFSYIFSTDSKGLLNSWLLKLGLITSPINFFQNTSWIVPICVIICLWQSMSTAFLSFIAGLQGIDRSQFEAAAVDGVTNRWQELWYVTIPNMKQQLMFGAVLAITGAFSFGSIVTQFCGSIPTDYVGYTLSMHMGEYANSRWEYGYASAIAMVIFLLTFLTNQLINKILSKVGT